MFTDTIRTLEFFGDSYLATIAIALVVSYLGVLVVLKRIVFLGITLAQAAAAGIAFVFFLEGHMTPGTALASGLDEYGPTFAALGVSTGGVAVFALPGEPKRLSRETLLAIGYALFGGSSVLLVWWSPKGVEELKNLLAGDVLFASSHLPSLALGLGIVAAILVAFRKEFLLASYDPDFGLTTRVPVRRYEVLLALSLGIAISLALNVAGILLVFAYLSVAPAAGLTLGRKLGEATAIALGVAAASSILGWLVATRADLPVAPTIACFLVAHFALAALVARAGRRAKQVYLGVVTALALVSVLAAFHVMAGRGTVPVEATGPVAPAVAPEKADLLAAFRRSRALDEQQRLAEEIVGSPDERLFSGFVKGIPSLDEDHREVAIAALEKIGDRARSSSVLATLLEDRDVELRLLAGSTLARLGDPRGARALLALLGDERAPPGIREEAIGALLKLNPKGDAFGFDPFAADESNRKALAAWGAWLSARASDKAPTRER